MGTATFGIATLLLSRIRNYHLCKIQAQRVVCKPIQNRSLPTQRSCPWTITQEEIDFLASHELIRGDSSRQVAMLTYDDARNIERIQHLLDVYRENGAKMTLFVIGTDLDSCKEILPATGR